MAIYRKGADPVALRGSARRLEHCAATANEVCDNSGQAVISLCASWGGGDLDALTSRWPAVEQQIRATHDTISRLARVLDRQAGEQEGTSASGSGGVPASVPGYPASYVPPGPLDQTHVDRARAAVDDVLDGPGFWALDGSRDDLLTAKQRIAALTRPKPKRWCSSSAQTSSRPSCATRSTCGGSTTGSTRSTGLTSRADC